MASTDPGSKRKGKSDRQINWIAWATLIPAICTVLWSLKVIQGDLTASTRALIAGLTTLVMLWLCDVSVITDVELRKQLAKAEAEKSSLRSAIMFAIKALELGQDPKGVMKRLKKAVWKDGDKEV